MDRTEAREMLAAARHNAERTSVRLRREEAMEAADAAEAAWADRGQVIEERDEIHGAVTIRSDQHVSGSTQQRRADTAKKAGCAGEEKCGSRSISWRHVTLPSPWFEPALRHLDLDVVDLAVALRRREA